MNFFILTVRSMDGGWCVVDGLVQSKKSRNFNISRKLLHIFFLMDLHSLREGLMTFSVKNSEKKCNFLISPFFSVILSFIIKESLIFKTSQKVVLGAFAERK